MQVQDSKHSFLRQEKNLLIYFHKLNQARQHADFVSKRMLKKESKRVREKYLFMESLEAGSL